MEKLYLGIDIGSTTFKAALINENGKVRQTLYQRTRPVDTGRVRCSGVCSRCGACNFGQLRQTVDKFLADSGVKIEDISCTVVTGSQIVSDPRVALKGADEIADIVETAVKSRLGDALALEKLFGKRDATAVDVFRGRLSRAFLEKPYDVRITEMRDLAEGVEGDALAEILVDVFENRRLGRVLRLFVPDILLKFAVFHKNGEDIAKIGSQQYFIARFFCKIACLYLAQKVGYLPLRRGCPREKCL